MYIIVRSFAILGVVLALLTACSEEPPTVGEATSFSDVCSRDNDGRRVAVDGYLNFPDVFTRSQSVVMRLHESDAFVGYPIGVQMSFGTELNQIEDVPDEFTNDDLQAHLADGTIAGFGTRVTVSGKVYFPMTEQPFSCALENPLVELAN